MKFFNQISLQTPESVELDFTLAGIGNRAYALMIDYLVLGFILVIFSIAWSLLTYIFLEAFTQLFGFLDQAGLWLFSIWLLVSFLIYIGYFVGFETIWRGQTPGKRFVKIRVIRDDGKSERLQQAALRSLLRPVDDLLFIGVFLIFFSKKEKRIGDLVAGTLVIQEAKPTFKADFSISERARELAGMLQQEVDLSRITPEEFAVIRDYLQRRQDMLPEARKNLSRDLAYQVKDIIGLEEVPAETTATQFLEAVYLAYQEQMSEE